MRRVSLIPAAILLLCFRAPLCAQSQDSKDSVPSPVEAIPVYPETTDGLKSLIQDLLDALTSEDTEKWSSLVSGLSIPDHSIIWFTKVFGPDEGGSLESKYVEVLPRVSDKLRQRFNYALDGQMNDVGISILTKTSDSGEKLDRAILDARIQPVPIYRAKGLGPVNSGAGAGPMGRFPTYLGDFVWVDGGFRYIDLQVFEALSTAPQLRIRQGEKVTAASIVYQPRPDYPREARARHIEGDVILHIIINKDGTVRNLELVNGDPALTKAAIDAVKKWKYTPTLLNGKPVEVDTIVTVTFLLNR